MRSFLLSLPLATLALLATAASAQTTVEGRVDRLEQEMRAVQRKVFPDGAGRYLTPAVTAPDQPVQPGGTPAASPIADLQTRVSAVEAQLRALTGQVEQNGYRLKQLEDAFAQYKADVAAREAAAAAAVVPVAAPVTPASKPAVPAKPGTSAKPAPASATKPAPASASDARKAAVATIEVPSTGNPAEDGYAYGYRLWQAKFYPEAQVQLKATVDKYPTSGVVSRAQNLLGRAYLDEGKPALASVAFYENYQKRPKSDRAADSLTWLGEALIQLKKLPDACKVYEELNEVYGATLRPELKAMAEKGRVRAKCGA